MLKGVVENDDKAWKEFYLFYKPLTGIVMRRLGIHPSEDDLNELHQRVMVELFQRGSVKKYQKERGHIRHYLKRIIHNKCCDFITLNAKEKGMEAEFQARCLQAFQETNARGRRGASSGSPARPRRRRGDAGDGGARQGISFPAGPLRRRKAGAESLAHASMAQTGFSLSLSVLEI